MPKVGLAARKAGAVDAALLTSAHADGLTALGVANGIGLGVFERYERYKQVAPRALGDLLIIGNDVFKQLFVDPAVVSAPLLPPCRHIGHWLRPYPAWQRCRCAVWRFPLCPL